MEKVVAIDVGNSLTKIGCFLEGQLEVSETFSTEKDDLKLFQRELEENLRDTELRLDGVVVSSVVPVVTPLLKEVLSAFSVGVPPLYLERESFATLNLAGVDFSHYNSRELGTDRVANIVAGYQCFPQQKVMVCDFGTTTTFDMVSEEGQFLGGAICPGPRKFQSLVDPQHAAQLYEVDVFEKPKVTPGNSTLSCLQNGLYYGYKGVILEVVGNLLQDAQWPLSHVTFLFTGGDAQRVRGLVTHEIVNVHVDAGVTLKGLYGIWAQNRTPVAR